MTVKTISKLVSSKKSTTHRLVKPRISATSRISEIAGCLSDADAQELLSIISSSCEKVDKGAW